MSILRNKTFLWIILFSFLQMGMMALSSSLSLISDEFKDISTSNIQLIATLPDIFIVTTTLLFGKISKIVTLKLCFIISCSLFTLTSIFGYLFCKNIVMLYLTSVLLGLAIGLLMPCVTTWISRYTKDNQRKEAIGYQNAAVSFGGILISILSAYLIRFGYKTVYFIYLLGMICLFGFVFYMPNDGTKEKESNKKIDSSVYKMTTILSIYVFVFFSLYNAISVNISQYLSELNIDSSFGGILLASLLSGSFVFALFYSKLAKLKFNVINILGLSLLIIGLFITISFTGVISLIIGQFISGGSLSIVMASCIDYLMDYKGFDNSYPVSIMLALSDAGGFFSAFYVVASTKIFLDNSSLYCLKLVLILSIVLLILMLIFGKKAEAYDKIPLF